MNNDKFSEDGKHISMQKEGILFIRSTEIELRTENIFGLSLVTDKVYKTNCDFMG